MVEGAGNEPGSRPRGRARCVGLRLREPTTSATKPPDRLSYRPRVTSPSVEREQQEQNRCSAGGGSGGGGGAGPLPSASRLAHRSAPCSRPDFAGDHAGEHAGNVRRRPEGAYGQGVLFANRTPCKRQVPGSNPGSRLAEPRVSPGPPRHRDAGFAARTTARPQAAQESRVEHSSPSYISLKAV